MPSLGGAAGVVEIVMGTDRRAQVHLLTFDGHPRIGWTRTESRRFSLSAAAYRRFAARVDAALARYRTPVTIHRSDGSSESIVCTDGPAFITERFSAGRVTSLAGSCPPQRGIRHANVEIVRLVYALICGRLGQQFGSRLDLGDRSARNRCSPRYRISY